MLLSKYTNQSADSNSSRQSRMKCLRSPPREKFPRHETVWAVGTRAMDGATPYAPYYFNGGWVQPPMAPYAFRPGRAAPRKSDRVTRPARNRLSNNANRSSQKSSSKGARKEWCPKSPSGMTLESGKQEQNVNADTIVVDTRVIKTQ